MNISNSDATACAGIPVQQKELRFDQETVFFESAEHRRSLLPYRKSVTNLLLLLSVSEAGDFGAKEDWGARGPQKDLHPELQSRLNKRCPGPVKNVACHYE